MSEKRGRRPFRVCAAYDTETTNFCLDRGANEWAAYPVLFIWNDLTGCDLATYEPDDSRVRFHRRGEGLIGEVENLIAWGSENGVVPVICAYNLMFDLQPVIFQLSGMYDLRANAQSSTHVYTLDALDDEGNVLVRFWDTFYLEMNGLDAMGKTCGVGKASGYWDYNLVRTQTTALTPDELHYAARDTEVIPAYLRYLMEANTWLKPDMLGCRVLTKTSLVRQAGKNEVGRIRVRTKDGRRRSVQSMFEHLCARELAPTYAQYALRKACFRGGLTFTSARYAGTVQHNVYSLDEVSAHHAYINGHMLPVGFRPVPPAVLDAYARRVVETPLEKVLARYENPFKCAFHAQIRFRNLRLRAGSAFERWQIATVAEGKFHGKGQRGEWGGEADMDAETGIRSQGYVDAARDAVFAFGKLYRAAWAVLNVSELELYVIRLAYEWDSMECVLGEATCKFVRPPDYVTLLSNLFFARKQDMKRVLKLYREGEPYPREVPASIPAHIADELRAGTAERAFLESYYSSTVKGGFNSIYGMEAQDVFKPSYIVVDGKVRVDPSTQVTSETYADAYKEKRDALVLYPYGLRIVGGSRLALAIAIETIWRALGERVRVLGGDTDSIKVSCDTDVCADDLMGALSGFHDAVTRSIDVCMARVRRVYPDIASDLVGVGTFEVEGEAYPLHMDAWNKARISWDGERAHVTCAGLSRPAGAYHIETWVEGRVAQGHPFEETAPQALGWGVRVAYPVCHALERTRPEPWERFEMDVTDYNGDTDRVSAYRSIALYPSSRVLGDVSQATNGRSVDFLRAMGRDVETGERVIDVSEDGRAVYSVLTDYGWEDTF